MNKSSTHKICEHLQLLVNKAAELTIDERGYWGLGHIAIFPDLQSFTMAAQAKYFVQIDSASKKLDESLPNLIGDDTDVIEPHYGTDWTAVCSMHGALRDLFLSYELETHFESDIEHSENHHFVEADKTKLKIHYVHHNLKSVNALTDSVNHLTDAQIDELYEKITKLTLFSLMSL
jgi:hypothetical protein